MYSTALYTHRPAFRRLRNVAWALLRDGGFALCRGGRPRLRRPRSRARSRIFLQTSDLASASTGLHTQVQGAPHGPSARRARRPPGGPGIAQTRAFSYENLCHVSELPTRQVATLEFALSLTRLLTQGVYRKISVRPSYRATAEREPRGPSKM